MEKEVTEIGDLWIRQRRFRRGEHPDGRILKMEGTVQQFVAQLGVIHKECVVENIVNAWFNQTMRFGLLRRG